MVYLAAVPERANTNLAPVGSRRRARGQADGGPSLDECLELLASMFYDHEREKDVQSKMHDLKLNKHAIPFPKNVPSPTIVYTSMAMANVQLLRGMLEEEPIIHAVTMDEDAKAKSLAQDIEDWDNNVWTLLEQQYGPIFGPVREDQLVHGYGVDRQTYASVAMSDKDPHYPARGANEAAAEYLKRRTKWIRDKGTGEGRFPLGCRWVDSRTFYFIEDDEEQGLTIAAEVQQRAIHRILDNPRYGDLPGLQGYYLNRYGQDNVEKFSAMARFIVLETPEWVTHLTLPDLPYRQWYSNMGVDSIYPGEIVEQYANPIGRVSYTLTKGLTTNTPDKADRHRGIFRDQATLIYALDAWISYRMTRAKDYIFPAAIITQQANSYQGIPFVPGKGPGGEDSKVELVRGGSKATRLRPGERVEFLTNPSGGPEEIEFQNTLRQYAGKIGIPDSFLDARGMDSGYLYASVEQTVMASRKPIITGFQAGHVHRCRINHALVVCYNEALTITTQADQQARVARWVTLDPEKIADFDYNLRCIYGIRKQANTLADLQAYEQAVMGGSHSEEEAAEEFLHKQDYPRTRERKLIDQWYKDPSVQQWIMTRALEKAGLMLDDEAVKQEGDINWDQLMNASPELVRVIAQRIQPGMPGFDLIQRFMQEHGMAPIGQQALPPGPGAASPPGPGGPTLTPPAPPTFNGVPDNGATLSSPPGQPAARSTPTLRLGGRPSGQRRQPTGPRRGASTRAY